MDARASDVNIKQMLFMLKVSLGLVQMQLQRLEMKFVISLIYFVFLNINFAFGGAQEEVSICFEIHGESANYTFNSDKVSYKEARYILNLSSSDSFLDDGIVIPRKTERRKLVNTEECNKVFGENQNATIAIQISEDQETNISLKNDAKLDLVRAELMKSLPEYYRNKKCADLYFVDKEGSEVSRVHEVKTQFQNILLTNAKIIVKNRFIENRTNVEIEWLLESWPVQVNMRASLSDLRYWITNPGNCPNLKGPLNLPDGPLFNTKNNADRTNWLARDKDAELEKIPNFKSMEKYSTALTAPYRKEKELKIESYVYRTETLSKRMYYVDVLEVEKTSFAGSKTDQFSGNGINVAVRLANPFAIYFSQKLLLLKDVRSTNSLALTWDSVAISTNNSEAVIEVEFLDHQDGYLYYCELFEHREKYRSHSLTNFIATNTNKCTFDTVGSLRGASNLIFNKETLIENGEDLTKYRYEIGVAMTPYRKGTYRCWTERSRRRRSPKTGNVDIYHDEITMGNVGKGKHLGDIWSGQSCSRENNDFSDNNKKTFHFNIFIFKSQEIAEKIIGNIPVM